MTGSPFHQPSQLAHRVRLPFIRTPLVRDIIKIEAGRSKQNCGQRDNGEDNPVLPKEVTDSRCPRHGPVTCDAGASRCICCRT